MLRFTFLGKHVIKTHSGHRLQKNIWSSSYYHPWTFSHQNKFGYTTELKLRKHQTQKWYHCS